MRNERLKTSKYTMGPSIPTYGWFLSAELVLPQARSDYRFGIRENCAPLNPHSGSRY